MKAAVVFLVLATCLQFPPWLRSDVCGDANGDSMVDVSDPVYVLSWLFAGGPAPSCGVLEPTCADVNGDAHVDVSDPIYILSWLFAGGDALTCRPALFQEPPERAPGEPCECSSCNRPDAGPEFAYLFSGEFHYSVEDLRVAGRGLDFVWARKYRSRIGPNTAQGNGWDFSYNIRVVKRGGKTVELYDGNTRRDFYRRGKDGAYTAAQFFREGRLAADKSFVLTFTDTGTWEFFPFDKSPQAGRIRAIRDRNGNALTFAYDALGRLVEITDTLDRTYLVSYNSDGFIESVDDFSGRRVTYAYYQDGDAGGGFGDLASVTTPAVTGTPNGNDFPDGKTTVYTYAVGSGDECLNHNLLTITDAMGQTWLVNRYADSTDRMAFEFDRLMSQAWGDPDEVLQCTYLPLDPAGDDQGAVVRTIVNDPVGNVAEYLFDAGNRLVNHRQYTGRADPLVPTTATDNRPMNRLRPDDPEFFETRYEYNADSLVTRMLDPNGGAVETAFAGDLDPDTPRRSAGNLMRERQVPGPLGGDQPELVETFEYHTGLGGCCGANFVTRATDARGNTTVHEYDDNGNRLRTIHRLPSIVDEYSYNEFGQMIEQIYPDNGSGTRRVDRWEYYGPADGHQNGYLKAEIIDAGNLALRNEYEVDERGNVNRSVDPCGNDRILVINQRDQIVRELSREIGGVRHRTDTYYDANDNVVRVDVANIDETGAPRANALITTTFEYEILNQQIRMTKEIADGDTAVTEYGYDGNRNRTLTRLGEAVAGSQRDNVIAIAFDERDLSFRHTTGAGGATPSTDQYDYDGNGNRVRMAEGIEDTRREWRYRYDGYNRLVRTTDPTANATEYGHDANGNTVLHQVLGELVDVPGDARNVLLRRSLHVFDAMDRAIEDRATWFDPRTGATIGDGARITTTDWSDASQVVRRIDDNGNETVKTYDSAHRLVGVVDAAGNSEEYVYDCNSNRVQTTEVEKSDAGLRDATYLTAYGYDALDRLISVTDDGGNTERYGYDSRGNMTSVEDALGNFIYLTYDGLDRRVRRERVLGKRVELGDSPVVSIVTEQIWDRSSRLVAQIDGNGNATRYGYDGLGRLATTTYADGTVDTNTWDVHGNLVVEVDANGTVVRTDYDLYDRPIAKTIVPGPGVSGDTTFELFEYDGMSRLVRAEDDDSVVTRSYDSLSQAMDEQVNGRAVTYTNDALGNKLAVAYPGGRVVTATYDALNRRKVIADGVGTIAEYRYRGPRRVEERTLAGPVDSHYGYDVERRMTSSTHLDQFAVMLDGWTYRWDGIGNIVGRTDVRPGGVQLDYSYTYDSARRLRDTVVRWGASVVRETRYGLDRAGNRTRVSGGLCSGVYVMDPTVREPADLQVNQYTTSGCGEQLSYDRAGNLELGELSRQSRRMTYDYRDQMVDLNTGVVSTYNYDPLGRRIGRTVGGAVTAYVYDGWQVVEEQDAAGLTVASYVYGHGMDDVVNMRRAGVDYYYLTDQLGSVVAVTDASGAVVERYDYDDFGKPYIYTPTGRMLPASQIGNPRLFTGAFTDPESGFVHLRTRYLDPALGRFTTRDSLGVWGDEASLGNGVGYAGNSPLTFTDPTGQLKSCGGPWPGPAEIGMKFQDCSTSRKNNTRSHMCKVFRAYGQAWKNVKHVVDYYKGNGGYLVSKYERQINHWFGGPDGKTNLNSKKKIRNRLKYPYVGFLSSPIIRIGFQCENSSNKKCKNNNWSAYVNKLGGATDIHLCPKYWNKGSRGRQETLAHEMSHEYAGTKDYKNSGGPYYANHDPDSLNLSTKKRRNHADTYSEFLRDFYLP